MIARQYGECLKGDASRYYGRLGSSRWLASTAQVLRSLVHAYVRVASALMQRITDH